MAKKWQYPLERRNALKKYPRSDKSRSPRSGTAPRINQSTRETIPSKNRVCARFPSALSGFCPGAARAHESNPVRFKLKGNRGT